MTDRDTAMRVGELARSTGVSVRTLHYYDEIGLLRPAVGGAGGHRLYTAKEVARLHDILSLRRLEFSLEEVRRCLDDPGVSPERIVGAHLERLEEELAKRTQLRDRLRAIHHQLTQAEGPTTRELLQTIEAMARMDVFDKYYTPEQMKALEARKELVGEERMREAQGEWNQIFADYGAALAQGLAPDSDEVLAIARRSRALIAEFTGGDAGIEQSLGNMYSHESSVRERSGAAPELWGYMGEANEALRKLE